MANDENEFTKEDMKIFGMQESLHTFIAMRFTGTKETLIIDALTALLFSYTQGQICMVIQQDAAGNFHLRIKKQGETPNGTKTRIQ